MSSDQSPVHHTALPIPSPHTTTFPAATSPSIHAATVSSELEPEFGSGAGVANRNGVANKGVAGETPLFPALDTDLSATTSSSSAYTQDSSRQPSGNHPSSTSTSTPAPNPPIIPPKSPPTTTTHRSSYLSHTSISTSNPSSSQNLNHSNPISNSYSPSQAQSQPSQPQLNTTYSSVQPDARSVLRAQGGRGMPLGESRPRIPLQHLPITLSWSK